jgi:hypothetical protein
MIILEWDGKHPSLPPGTEKGKRRQGPIRSDRADQCFFRLRPSAVFSWMIL